MIRGSDTLLIINLGEFEQVPTQVDVVFKRLPFEKEEVLLTYSFPTSPEIEYRDGKFYLSIAASDTYKLPYDEAYVDVRVIDGDGRILLAKESARIIIAHSSFDNNEEENSNENN